MVVVSIKLT